MNYMKQVAEMLGVSMNEVFEVEDDFRGEMDKKKTCRLTEKGLQVHVRVIGCRGDITDNWVGDGRLLIGLLSEGDRFNIVKKPWMPKDGDTYHSYFHSSFGVGLMVWDSLPSDFARYKSGMVFRNVKEAIDARPRIYEELTGKKWSDQP